MRKLIIILLGLSLLSCSIEVKDRDGNIMTMEQIEKEGKAIERAINKELNKEVKEINKVAETSNSEESDFEDLHSKDSQTEKIVGGGGVSIKHNGKSYTIDEYVHIKMEWAYFQAQKEAIKGDVRISNADGCWKWIESPWDGKPLTNVLYEPECGEENTGDSYKKVTEEVKLTPYVPNDDAYDTDY